MPQAKSALLRPGFTRMLAERLRNGASINLTARHGLGRRRTLQDLRSLLPEGVWVLYADMKTCLNDFPATMRDLCAQAGLEACILQDLGGFIEVLSAKGGDFLLILHNFDLLRHAAHDARFDTGLLPYLSRIEAQHGLALLTVCEAVYADWELPCEALSLPPLDETIRQPAFDAEA